MARVKLMDSGDMTQISTTGDDMASAIELRNVSKTFQLESGEMVTAVDDVSKTIRPGEFVCVVGASGHGKSTLLKLIAGFDNPSSGEVRANGAPVMAPGPDRGVVFQQDTLFLWRRVRDNIAFGLKARGIPKAEREERVRHFLEVTGLERFATAWPKQLSGGMRRRAAIAAVLANEPDVLLMDEPFVGLDFVRRAQLHRVLLDLWEDAGHRAVFMITHDIDEALTLADRIWVVRNGKVVLDRPITLDRPRTTEAITSPAAVDVRRDVLQHIGG